MGRRGSGICNRKADTWSWPRGCRRDIPRGGSCGTWPWFVWRVRLRWLAALLPSSPAYNSNYSMRKHVGEISASLLPRWCRRSRWRRLCKRDVVEETWWWNCPLYSFSHPLMLLLPLSATQSSFKPRWLFLGHKYSLTEDVFDLKYVSRFLPANLKKADQNQNHQCCEVTPKEICLNI